MTKMHHGIAALSLLVGACGEAPMVALDLSAAGIAGSVNAPEGATARAGERGAVIVEWDDVELRLKEGDADVDFVRGLWNGSENHEVLRDEERLILTKQRALGRDEFHIAVDVDVAGTTYGCTDGDWSHIEDQDDAELALRVCQSLRGAS